MSGRASQLRECSLSSALEASAGFQRAMGECWLATELARRECWLASELGVRLAASEPPPPIFLIFPIFHVLHVIRASWLARLHKYGNCKATALSNSGRSTQPAMSKSRGLHKAQASTSCSPKWRWQSFWPTHLAANDVASAAKSGVSTSVPPVRRDSTSSEASRAA